MECTSNSNKRVPSSLTPTPRAGKCPLAHSRLLGPKRSCRQGCLLGIGSIFLVGEEPVLTGLASHYWN